MSRFSVIFLTVGIYGGLALPAGLAQVNVLTQHNDNFRTGQNTSETILTPANVNSGGFGMLFSQAVDGIIYAQPLYMSKVNIPGLGVHNVVYVATENDSVFAFDADSNQGANAKPLWTVSFTNSAQGITAVPSSDQGCGDIVPEIGITGTPVIDPSTNTLYVVANTKENGSYVQRLHALDVATGAEKFGGPVEIQATSAGQTFNPLIANQRAGLLFQSGMVYIVWGSHCDFGPFTGWLIAYDAKTLIQRHVWTATTDYGDGGVWMGGTGLAGDGHGDIFFATGNGTFDGAMGGCQFGDSIVRMGMVTSRIKSAVTTKFRVKDYFAPKDQKYLDDNDFDLGSGGVVLLPPQPGTTTQFLVQSGKEGSIFLADRNHLGGYDANSDNNLQTLYWEVGGIYGAPAYWNSTLYFWGVRDYLKAYSITNGRLSTAPAATGSVAINYPTTTPSVSANGSTNGIVWGIDTSAYSTKGPAVLRAFDAVSLGDELYDSSQNPARDNAGGAVRFSVPTIANGKVFVGTTTMLCVYGLLSN
jgi:hypothetical protein